MAGKAEVKYDAEALNAAAVTQLIEDLGFGAELIKDNVAAHGKLDLTVSLHTLQKCSPSEKDFQCSPPLFTCR